MDNNHGGQAGQPRTSWRRGARSWMGVLASSVMAAGIVGIAGPASVTTVTPAESCAQLESVDLNDVTRIEAELVTDGRVVDQTGVSGGDREGLPEFCRVQLTPG